MEARIIQFLLGFIGMKRAMERKVLNNTYSKEPAGIPATIHRHFRVEVGEHNHRKVWTISPKNPAVDSVILFLHGGAYYANIMKMHWQLVRQILVRTDASIIVPDYPLAPESTCIETYRFLGEVYAKLVAGNRYKSVVFMGDSAGGGLALGLAMKIRDEGMRQPQQIILFSPWLDVSMTSPEVSRLENCDKILSVHALKEAGQKYAGGLPLTDYRVSPIYGSFYGLGKISVFTGTNEVLFADAQKLGQLLADQKADFNYFEYPGMFHDFILVTGLKGTRDVIEKVVKYLSLSDN